MRSLAVLAVFLSLITTTIPAQSAVFYVRTDGSDTNSGTSWELAKQTVQAGLDAASAGDEVWVAAGTYVQRITLKNGVALYGGFTGSEMLLEERDFEANETILDGNKQGNVVSSPYTSTTATRIDGFTIRNGAGTSFGAGSGVYCTAPITIANNKITGNSSAQLSGGGGIYSNGSSVITNNIIAGNTATGSGGGIYCTGSGQLIISGNTITGNSASGSGGGVYCHYISATITNNTISSNSAHSGGGINCYYGSPTITNNMITANSAYGSGGGVYCYSGTPTITNNTISGNTASEDGGGIYSGGTISSNTITGNSASGNGGGAYCAGGTADNNTIIGNRASGVSSCGGGIYGSGTATANTINRNTAVKGGGIYFGGSSTIANNRIIGNSGTSWGGGIYCNCTSSQSPSITNNVIACNDAGTGGGIALWQAKAVITGNTIVWNIGSEGGICSYYNSWPTISNNIIAFNTGGIYQNPDNSQAVCYNNCVYENANANYGGPITRTNDISVDPKLADVAHGNYHLQPDSPCINAGWNDAPGLSSTDMDGQPRIQDGTVDIGADESDGTLWPLGPYGVVRVSNTGDDANDGSCWTQAKRTVQAGVDTASLLGREVWVKAGTYYECTTLAHHSYLYGGFAGSETTRSERDWAANATILDGGAAGSVVTVKAGNKWSTIDGFTIRNGNGTANPSGSSRFGGGVSCFRRSSPIITNNTITENSSGSGGGIYSETASPIIIGNTISGNNALAVGGGLYAGGSTPVISRNRILRNTAGVGAGILCSSSSCLLTNNIITHNTAVTSGGGVSVSSSTIGSNISNNTIAENAAVNGGGMYLSQISNNPPHNVSNNIVASNASGIYRGGTGPLSLRNNCVFGNTSYDYSGLSPGTGDISADPLFIDKAAGNYHLSITSPCINAGWNDAEGLPVTDMDGEPRICAGVVDIGADECWLKAGSVRDAKATANGMMAEMSGSIVSAAFPNHFYIEAEDRSSGIRVEKAGHELEAGMTSFISGAIGTNNDGEKFIAADTAVSDGEGSVKPLFLSNKTLGGGNSVGFSLATGSGQRGVDGGFGLNNIGLLITTTGWLTYSSPEFFYIDDGSGLNDGSGHLGVKVLGPGPDPGEDGKYLRVTGVSSIRESGGNHIRAIESCVEDGIQVLK
jgi:parallel beta-helix repeat protein